MKCIKINYRLYRLYNDGSVKDVWLGSNEELLEPENDHNILTEEEKDFVMDFIMNE